MTTVRISVAALVRRVINAETQQWAHGGLANKGSWQKKQQLLFTAIAGGALAWPEGESLLNRYGADFTGAEREGGGVDLRFTVSEKVVEDVLNVLVWPDPRLFESPLECITREVVGTSTIGGELTTAEIPGLQDQPILTPEQAKEISFRPLQGYRQPLPDDGVGTSANSAAIRYFYLFDMYVSNEVWNALDASPIVRLFTEETAALTRGGRTKAVIEEQVSADTTRQVTIGDNIFVLPE